jgi:mannose-1-phosphate guanylyltransferase
MKAMILAAGKGTRLVPLTYICPKVLVPIANIPLIDRTIEYLRIYGVREIIINAYHLHGKIIDYLEALNKNYGILEVRVENDILGTGGGIKNTEDFWGEEPFIIINGDIVTNIDLGKVYTYHKDRNNLVTMVLHDCPRHNKIIVDNLMNILSIGPNMRVKNSLAFTGIHVINPEVLRYIPKHKKYDILECYKGLIARKKGVRGYMARGHRWVDVGTLKDYIKANLSFLPANRNLIAPHCVIDSNAGELYQAIVGNGCTIEKGATVKKSILWDNVIIKEGVKVIDSIITSGVTVKKDAYKAVATK